MHTDDIDFKNDPVRFISERVAEMKVVLDENGAVHERKTLVVSPSIARIFNAHINSWPYAPKFTIKGSTIAKAKRKRNCV